MYNIRMKREVRCNKCGYQFFSIVKRPSCSICGRSVFGCSDKKIGILKGMEVGEERVFDWEDDVRNNKGPILKYERAVRNAQERLGWKLQIRTNVYNIKIRRVR